MAVLKQDKYSVTGQTQSEKRREEYIKSQNSNYRTYVSALKVLESMKKDKTFEARATRLNKLGSSIRGAGTPKLKLERILYSFRKLKEVDYILDDIKDAEDTKINPKDVQSRLKTALFEEEVKSTLHSSIFTIEESMENIQSAKVLHGIQEYFSPPPDIKYEESEERTKIIIITIDESDIEDIKKYMDTIFGESIISLEQKPYPIMTTLYDVLIELFVESFGEYPTFHIKQSGDIAAYIKNIKSQLLRKITMPKKEENPMAHIKVEGPIISKDSLDSAFSGVEGEIRLLTERKKELNKQLEKHAAIDIEAEMVNYQNKIEGEISEIKSQLEEMKERFNSTKTKLKSLKEKEDSLGQLSATEYVEGKKELEPDIKEANRVLQIITIQGDKLKEKLAILEKADSTSIRSKIESGLMDEHSGQINNIKELNQKIIRLKHEITLPRPIKKTMKELVKTFNPNDVKGNIMVDGKPVPFYGEYITALTKYERMLISIGRKIGLEMVQMKEYLRKNEKLLENTANYFIGLLDSPLYLEEDSDLNLEVVMELNKKSLTEKDLMDIQEEVKEVLKLKREVIRLTNKGKELMKGE